MIELDPATLKLPEWQTGGTLQLSIESERGGAPQTIEVPFQAGQRSVVVEGPDEALAPGRYTLRAEARSERSGSSVRVSTDVVVAAAGATISSRTLPLRRGPATGLAYVPTADPRFRRTERIRLEVPILREGPVTAVGRVLTREGQPLPLQVTTTERIDDKSGARYLVAEVTLAPLAQGDFVLELTAGKDTATYAFRIIP